MSGRRVTALGLRALRGGAVVVAVAADDAPEVVLSSFLATAEAGDRLSLEPYHVAFEMARDADGQVSPELEAAVAKGLSRQRELATTGLRELLTTLSTRGCDVVVGSLLVNRAGWVTDRLSYSLAYADHPPVAEGLAVREALRVAFGAVGVALAECDEKSLLSERAPPALQLDEDAIGNRLKGLGAGLKPWRKEQKLACLAAWLQLLARDDA